VNSVLELRVPQNAEKLFSGQTTDGLSNSAQLHRVNSHCCGLVLLRHFNPSPDVLVQLKRRRVDKTIGDET
jgi:hypothetical protein